MVQQATFLQPCRRRGQRSSEAPSQPRSWAPTAHCPAAQTQPFVSFHSGTADCEVRRQGRVGAAASDRDSPGRRLWRSPQMPVASVPSLAGQRWGSQVRPTASLSPGSGPGPGRLAWEQMVTWWGSVPCVLMRPETQGGVPGWYPDPGSSPASLSQFWERGLRQE